MKKKKLVTIVSVIILVIIIGVFAIWLFKTPIISSLMSRKLGIDISMSHCSFSKNHAGINHFVVKNPKGFSKTPALFVNKIDVDYSMNKVKKNPSEVDKISFDEAVLYIQCEDAVCSKNNWSKILDILAEKKGIDKHVEIKTLAINNLKVKIVGLGLSQKVKKDLSVDDLVLHNISSEKGFPTEEVILALFKSAKLQDVLKGIIDYKNFFHEMILPFGKLQEKEAS